MFIHINCYRRSAQSSHNYHLGWFHMVSFKLLNAISVHSSNRCLRSLISVWTDPRVILSVQCEQRSISMQVADEITDAYIDGLVQDCSNSIANALELLQCCTKPSILWKARRSKHWSLGPILLTWMDIYNQPFCLYVISCLCSNPDSGLGNLFTKRPRGSFKMNKHMNNNSNLSEMMISQQNWCNKFHIESTKNASMEDVSTGVLEKIKNIKEVMIKPDIDMMYQDIYNCICQNVKMKKNKIYYPVFQTYSPTGV